MNDICVACGKIARPHSMLCDDCIDKSKEDPNKFFKVHPGPIPRQSPKAMMYSLAHSIIESSNKQIFKNEVILYNERYWNILQRSVYGNGKSDFHIRDIETGEEAIISDPTKDMFKRVMLVELPMELL